MQARERSLAIIVGVLVGVWLVDALFVGPIMTWFDEQEQEIGYLDKEVVEAQVLVERKNLILQRWRSRHAAGLLLDEQSARFQMQEFIVEAAKNNAVLIENVGGNTRPAQGADEVYAQINMSLSGQGSLRSLKAFISAIERAPMPLRIERCELASHDSKKDQLELSASISSLIVADHAIQGRAVPEDTVLWKSDAAVAGIDDYIVAAKPFLADRRKPVKAVQKKVESKPLAKVVVDPGTWAVVGITRAADRDKIFLRHSKRAEELERSVGDTVDGMLLQRIENNVLFIHVPKSQADERLLSATEESVGSQEADIVTSEKSVIETEAFEERAIAIGFTFTGQAFSAAAVTLRASAVQPSTTGSTGTTTKPTGQSATTSSGADRQAILERLRNRRSRKDGK